jgi:DNA-3-methyladenine glycosylase I
MKMIRGVNKMNRCNWVTNDPVYIHYHDHEWGIPVYEDQKLFEMLSLEGAQAGLNWITILKRRENYKKAFDQFNIDIVANYSEEKIQSLLQNPEIIRNEKKIRSVVKNARLVIEIQKDFGSFSNFLWNYVNNQPIINHWSKDEEVPANTALSKKISNDLRKKGFSFVGPTIIYSFMQAIGMVNDHLITCFCHPAYIHNSK